MPANLQGFPVLGGGVVKTSEISQRIADLLPNIECPWIGIARAVETVQRSLMVAAVSLADAKRVQRTGICGLQVHRTPERVRGRVKPCGLAMQPAHRDPCTGIRRLLLEDRGQHLEGLIEGVDVTKNMTQFYAIGNVGGVNRNESSKRFGRFEIAPRLLQQPCESGDMSRI